MACASAEAAIGILEDDLSAGIPFWSSAFRIRTYKAILESFSNARVFSTRSAAFESSEFAEFLRQWPVFEGRILPVALDAPQDWPLIQVAYAVFLSNAFAFAHLLEETTTPLILELHPGGGITIGQRATALMLDRITRLRSLRPPIVTHPDIARFLVEKGYLPGDRITYVLGGVLLDPDALAAPRDRIRYGFGKSTLDLCFILTRSPGNAAGAVDFLVPLMRRLKQALPRARFHVVGDHRPPDSLAGDAAPRVEYHGPLHGRELRALYGRMDLLVLPPRATTASLELDGEESFQVLQAGLEGTPSICTTPTNVNRELERGGGILLVEPSGDRVASTIEDLANHPTSLLDLADRTRSGLCEIYGREHQIEPRLRLLAEAAQPDLSGTGMTERDPAPNHLYNAGEIQIGLRIIQPDDTTLQRFAYTYKLVEAVQGRLFLACPRMGTVPETEVLLDLGRLGPDRVNGIDLLVGPHCPIDGVDPPPLELILSLHQFSSEPALVEKRFAAPTLFSPTWVSLRTHSRGRVRCLRLRLRLLPGAAHETNAALCLSWITGVTTPPHSVA